MKATNSADYIPRLADIQLKKELKAFGAVVIVGPKRCGKTTTALQHSNSTVFMLDSVMSETYKWQAKNNPIAILEGDNPKLIDEWQIVPSLWGAIRHEIDMRREEGLYILTGSVTVDEEALTHSGAGRITKMRMRTMSLYESGNSVGEVSLADLFKGRTSIRGLSKMKIRDISGAIARGGWPGTLSMDEASARRQVAGYCETVLDSDIQTVDGKTRNKQAMRSILKSLSRNESTAAPDTTILKDMQEYGDMHINTLRSYLRTLDRIYVTDNMQAWSPKLRSKSTVMSTDTRHLADPSIAAYFLGAGPEDLENDPRTFGLLFESLVVRDLRAYTQALDGDVYHYRDRDGLEADAIIHLHNGKWCAIEVKLGTHDIDEGAKNLIKLRNKIDEDRMNPPTFLAVITGIGPAYTREDGVHVIPVGCLRD